VSAAPLAGLLVVDLTRHLPGPLAARLLADLGARRIKVEEPELGDPVRQAPPLRDGRSALAALLLSGAESVALDLKREGGRRVLGALLARADCLLESFRPGVLARLGFAPEELRRRYPRLVIASLSGFGQEGPAAGRAGHDLTYQAVAGLLRPGLGMPGLPAADLLGAWSAFSAVLAALYERERTGQGAWLDASLLDGAVHGNLVRWAEAAAGPAPAGAGDLAGDLPCYNLYRARGGELVALALLEPKFWRRFCDRCGRRDLRRLQFRREPPARRQVADLIASRPAGEWARLFAAEDLPAEVVPGPPHGKNGAEGAEGAGAPQVPPQVAARAIVRTGAEGLPRLAFPVRFDGERPGGGGELPRLGGSTRAWLAELGDPMSGAGRLARVRTGIGRRWSWRSLLWRFTSG